MDGVLSDGEGELPLVPLHLHHVITVIVIVALVILIPVILKLWVHVHFQRVGLSFKRVLENTKGPSLMAALSITSLCCWFCFLIAAIQQKQLAKFFPSRNSYKRDVTFISSHLFMKLDFGKITALEIDYFLFVVRHFL